MNELCARVFFVFVAMRSQYSVQLCTQHCPGRSCRPLLFLRCCSVSSRLQAKLTSKSFWTHSRRSSQKLFSSSPLDLSALFYSFLCLFSTPHYSLASELFKIYPSWNIVERALRNERHRTVLWKSLIHNVCLTLDHTIFMHCFSVPIAFNLFFLYFSFSPFRALLFCPLPLLYCECSIHQSHYTFRVLWSVKFVALHRINIDCPTPTQ